MLRELKALRPETLMVSLLESIEQACPHGCPFCPDAGKVFFGCHRLLDTSYLRLYLVEASFHLPLCLTLLLCELAKAGGHVLGSVDRASMQQVPN